MIIGGQAVLLYGEPRFTKEIDITLGLDLNGIEKIKRIVQKLELKPLIDNIEEFIKKTYVFPVIDMESNIRIDFIFSYSLYEREALNRVNIVKIDDTEVNFASLEDVIIHKIVANRARDIEDVKKILLKNSEYNKNYILKWLKEFDKTLNTSYTDIFKKIIKENC